MSNRKPSDQSWRLRAANGARHSGVPKVGWYRTKLVKKGPWTPARIFWCDHEPGDPGNILDQPYLVAVVVVAIGDERELDPVEVCDEFESVTEEQYNLMLRIKARAERHAPWEPEAQPHQKIDLRRQPSLF